MTADRQGDAHLGVERSEGGNRFAEVTENLTEQVLRRRLSRRTRDPDNGQSRRAIDQRPGERREGVLDVGDDDGRQLRHRAGHDGSALACGTNKRMPILGLPDAGHIEAPPRRLPTVGDDGAINDCRVARGRSHPAQGTPGDRGNFVERQRNHCVRPWVAPATSRAAASSARSSNG